MVDLLFCAFDDLGSLKIFVYFQGATIVDMSVTITPAPDYELPPAASAPPPVTIIRLTNFCLFVIPNECFWHDYNTLLQPKETKTPGGAGSAFRKSEDVVSSMLAKGFILGKDAVNKAKSFDEKHRLTSTATSKVVSFDKKIGFTEKISAGTSAVNEKVREVDKKFQVSEKTKSAFAAAEQKVSSAGSAIMKNRYVFTGASWVTGAFNKVAKAAEEVGQKTKEKVGKSEDEEKRKITEDFAQVHLSDSPKASASDEQHPTKPAPAQGLILWFAYVNILSPFELLHCSFSMEVEYSLL